MYRLLISSFIAIILILNTACYSACLADDKNTNVDKETKKEQVDEKEKKKSPEELKAFEDKCVLIDPVDLVGEPQKHLNEYVLIKGTFDKYTTLGLDYKPALKDSKEYISFLIRRPDVKSKKYVIPLSELKLIIARKMAEQYTSLETGDDIIIYGQVFSSALNDPWVEVDHIVSKTKNIEEPPKDNGSNIELEEE
ncbi:MAG: hypothetical protein AB1782_10175 [Cyanobacteriota bacterium]